MRRLYRPSNGRSKSKGHLKPAGEANKAAESFPSIKPGLLTCEVSRPAPSLPPIAFPLVGVSAAAGEMGAFIALLEALPSDTGMAFVFLQHLPPESERALIEILQRHNSMPVHPITGMDLQPNHIYVGSPNAWIAVTQGTLPLQRKSKRRGVQRGINDFLRSLADQHGSHAFAVVLSGGASDQTIALLRNLAEVRRTSAAMLAAKEKLAHHTEELERAVSERTAELQKMTAQVEAFDYSIAHDLRAPLRAVQGFASLLKEDAGFLEFSSGRDYCERIVRSAKFMDALLIDLLAFSHTSHTALELVAIDLDALLNDLIRRADRELFESHASFERIGSFPCVIAHAPTLEQALFNLLSNAAKFVPNGVRPHVRVEASYVDKGKRVEISVADNGIGIAPEHQVAIFRLFNRLNGDKYPGTGLGLTIAQKGVERMGGQIGSKSQPGSGSQFWIQLPAAR